MDTLEYRFSYFLRILPKVDSRHGIINFGSNILKTPFGAATIADLHNLYIVLDTLQLKDADIVRSYSNQRTYFKRLDHVPRVNIGTIANLPTFVKYIVVQSYDRFLQITRDILYLNVTMYVQSELYTAIRRVYPVTAYSAS